MPCIEPKKLNLKTLTELGLRVSQPKWRGTYPSGPASMPFMLYHHRTKNDSLTPCPRGVGLFYGALDPRAAQKELEAFPTSQGKQNHYKSLYNGCLMNIDPLGVGLAAKLFPENNILPFTRQIDSETTFLIGKSGKLSIGMALFIVSERRTVLW